MSVSYGGSSITFEDGSIVSSGNQGFKNKIINGDFRIDQRYAGAANTPVDGQYTIDRWQCWTTQSGKLSIQQSTTAPSGFSNSMLVTSLSSYSVSSNDEIGFTHKIEGYNTSDLSWGTAGAKTVTLSFWVRSSLTGTFGGILANAGPTRCYPFSYTINSANTFEYKTITITGDTSGTWEKTNATGVTVHFQFGVGSTRAGTSGAWVTSSTIRGVTGQVNLAATNGATWYMTGLQLEKGTTASSFEFRSYGKELMLCQRYYQKSYDTNSAVPVVNSITGAIGGYKDRTTDTSFLSVRFKVEMRATPTVTTYDYSGISGKMTGNSNSSLNAISYQQGTSGFNVGSGTGNPGVDSYVNFAATAEL
jgi:hypothetical protein